MKIFRPRNKKTGEFLADGPSWSRTKRLYYTLGTARSALANHCNQYRADYGPDEFEIVEYDLIETAIHSHKKEK